MEEATRRATAALASHTGRARDAFTVKLGPGARGAWVATASWPTGDYGELGHPLYDGAQARLFPQDTTIEELGPMFLEAEWFAERDVTGTGGAEWLADQGCGVMVYSAQRQYLTGTTMSCCGC